MKKYSITYDWKCITEREWHIRKVNTSEFKGHLAVLDIKKVSEPQVWKYNGKDLTVCDNNYQWLIMLPENDFYCITAMMNEKREIQVCYIDMIAGQGCDEDGVPYYYDLYLDLVVYPDGTIIVDDRDELDAALESGDITRQQFDLALATSDKLQKGLLCDMEKWKAFIYKMHNATQSLQKER